MKKEEKEKLHWKFRKPKSIHYWVAETKWGLAVIRRQYDGRWQFSVDLSSKEVCIRMNRWMPKWERWMNLYDLKNYRYLRDCKKTVESMILN